MRRDHQHRRRTAGQDRGDEVFYNAETPEAGAEIALALAEAIAADDVLPQARVSVVWGRVLSRMGDIYGRP